MNLERHWNSFSGKYDEEIFDVYANDRLKKIPRYLDKHAKTNSIAIDFGCGTGKSFPWLSPRFKKVIGYDISSELLANATRQPYKNIILQQADLTIQQDFPHKADFAFCCNVMMFIDRSKNLNLLKNISRSLKRNGKGMMVVPSLDSIIYASARLIEAYEKDGIAPEKIPADEFDYFKGNFLNILRGNIYIDQVPTKHFSEPELHLLFQDADLKIKAIDKVEYNWDTEMSSPPTWLKAPYPWDWLVEFSK